MKVAITGEKGFLGRNLFEYYKNKCEVICLGKNYLDNLHKIIDCDFLIHTAGVNRSYDPQKIYDENILITKNLIQKLTELHLKVNIKFISSIQENQNNFYGNSKLESKKLLQNYCNESKTNLETYILPNIFGMYGKPNYNSFINTFIVNILNEIPTDINDNLVELCWVHNAINVIDNQTKLYNTNKVKVSYVYEILQKIHNNFDFEKNEFTENLVSIYNFFKNYKTKILVLGHNGMLGHSTVEYFKRKNFEVSTTNHRFPSENFKKDILDFNGDFIINCIGAIPQRTNLFKINTDLPIWLSNNSECKIIHPGTDCESDNDEYGISKRLASEYINLYSRNTKILKTSIIGPEMNSNYGLLEWFLSQDKTIFGFTEAIWNGNTTLEWSKQAHQLMINWYYYKPITILEGQPISKYEMLNLFKKIYNKNINILPQKKGLDKCLKGDIKTKSLEEQLIELDSFWK
jgi:nucleoside-diphosphate-sugar epimerase